jgi:hypothetical protein
VFINDAKPVNNLGIRRIGPIHPRWLPVNREAKPANFTENKLECLLCVVGPNRHLLGAVGFPSYTNREMF